ncbi:MAG: transaldolase family protein [Candidatus Omnitrophota bacterium]|nr:transaldolase family protein [Candidatus Omnitrophota bacterium]
MSRVNRVASLVVLIAFICNTFLFDTGFAQELLGARNSDTLATLIKSDDMLGKDIQGTRGISILIMELFAAMRKAKQPITPQTLKELKGVSPEVVRAIDNIRNGRIFRHEAEAGLNGVITLKAVINNVRYVIEYDPAKQTLSVYPKDNTPSAKSREVPTAAAVRDAGPMDCADHRVLNAMLDALFYEVGKNPKAFEKFLVVDKSNKINWFVADNKKSAGNFLAIFEKLIEVTGLSEQELFSGLLGRANVGPELHYGYSDFLRQLSSQAAHFGVESGWIYAVAPWHKDKTGTTETSVWLYGMGGFTTVKDQLLAHEHLERSFHLAVVKEAFEGDWDKYRQWRTLRRDGQGGDSWQGKKTLNFTHMESGKRIVGELTYNEFATLAYRITQAMAPYGDISVGPDSRKYRTDTDFEAPVAAAAVMNENMPDIGISDDRAKDVWKRLIEIPAVAKLTREEQTKVLKILVDRVRNDITEEGVLAKLKDLNLLDEAAISECLFAAGVRLNSPGLIQDLKFLTRILERDVVSMIYKAGSGHPGGSLSMLKAVVALYFGTNANGERIMRYDPSDPNWEYRDRFVLSKGHAAPGLYAALARAQYFAKRIADLKKQGKLKTEDVEEFLETLRKLGSDLQGHPDMAKTIGVEFSGGPLGVAFSAAVAMATAAVMDDKDYITYCIIGDGETEEGQVDEAGRHAGAILKQKQDETYREAAAKGLKIVAFLDWNGYQIDNKVTDVDVDYEGQIKLWEARGWNVVRANGEDIEDVMRATQEAKKSLGNGKPAIVIMKTTKGAGLPGMAKHGEAPKEAEVKEALAIIDADLAVLSNGRYTPENHREAVKAFVEDLIRKISLGADTKARIEKENKARVGARREALRQITNSATVQKAIQELEKGYPEGKNVATRTATGHELTLIGADNIDVVAMSADLMGSNKFDGFAKLFGTFSADNLLGRYIPVGIREAHMVSFAAGLAACGKIPVIGTFSIFTTRMVDQLNAILNANLPIIIVGTHGGLATGPDGRTHQDAHSLGVLGALPGVQTYEGADAEEQRVLFRGIYDVAKKKGGIHYIRPARLDTPVIQNKPEGWQEGARRGFYKIFDTESGKNRKKSQSRDIVIVSSGVVTAEAINAAKDLSEKYGLSVEVVNVTQLKSITADEANKRDFEKLIERGRNIISVIDALPGLLGDKIDNILARRNAKPQFVRNLGIDKYGESGTPAELYKKHGFDKDGIVKTARLLAGKGISLLRKKGQSVWADGAFTPEEIRFFKKKGVTGQTTNLTIINNAIKAGMFDKEIQHGIAEGWTPEQIYDYVCILYMKQMAVEWFPVFNKTKHLDGYISIEVNPKYAYDVQNTVNEAMRLVNAIGMPNVMVKVPATPEGVKAVEELTYNGINVNVTLLFGVSNYEDVARAYMRGLERRVTDRKPIYDIQSVASFFVSRVNCKPDAADEQIRKAIAKEKARTDNPKETAANITILESLIGKAAIANTVLASDVSNNVFLYRHRLWEQLLNMGAAPQRLLWASTEIKSNEAYADGARFSPLMYVSNLPLQNTVNTMPKDTLHASIMATSVEAEPRNDMTAVQAQEVMYTLSKCDIDINAITTKLQEDGVEAFKKDYAASLQFIKEHVKAVRSKQDNIEDILKPVIVPTVDQPVAAMTRVKTWLKPSEVPPEKRVIIMISGGEAPGVNNYFALLAKALARFGMTLEIQRFGLDTLVKSSGEFAENRVWVDQKMADELLNKPGAAQGTSRVKLNEELTLQAMANLQGYCKTVVFVGGNDHMGEAAKIAKKFKESKVDDMMVLVLPKTIDGDTMVYPMGADSAGQNANEFSRRASPEPGSWKCVVFQMMGRDMGYLTVSGALESPISVAAVPEWSVSPNGSVIVSLYDIAEAVRSRMNEYGASAVFVSEGFRVSAKDQLLQKILKRNKFLAAKFANVKTDVNGNPLLAELGIADFVAEALAVELGLERDKNLFLEDTGYSGRSRAPNKDSIDIITGELAIATAVPLITEEAKRKRVISDGGVCIAADKGSRTVVDIQRTMRARPVSEAMGKVDLKDSGIFTEAELCGKNVLGVIGPKENLRDLLPSEKVKRPSGYDINAAIDAINSQSESAFNMRRPNVCVIARPDADEIIDSLDSPKTLLTTESYRYVKNRTAGAVALFPSSKGPVSLTELVGTAHNIYITRKMLNMVVAGNLAIKADDALLVKLSRDEKYGEAFKALVEGARPDKDGNLIFGRRIIDLIHMALTVEKGMTGIRKNILGESLNKLPEINISAAPSFDEQLRVLQQFVRGNELPADRLLSYPERSVFSLDLNDTDVADLAPLYGLPSLRVVSLVNTKITNSQAYELFRNHPAPENLLVLDSDASTIKYSDVPLAYENTKSTAQSAFMAAVVPAVTTATRARDIFELLRNIGDSLKVTADSVIILDAAKFHSQTVDYLAFESAFSENPDVKAAAQRILREAAISFNLKLASINDFYAAKKDGKWGKITVPAVNGRTDVYHQYQQLFRAAKDKNVGVLLLELARSEMRYSAQDMAEFTAVSIAAAIKQGYEGLIFAQGDHYQVNKEKYDKGGDEREKELKAIEELIRKSMLAGVYNIDLDPSTLVDEGTLNKITQLENAFVREYLDQNVYLLYGLDDNGRKSLWRRLVDEIEMGDIKSLTPVHQEHLERLYKNMHRPSILITMRFIRYIRALEEELGLTMPVSIGIEERHIDNPKHKNNPSTVLGSVTLAKTILAMAEAEGLVGPSKISLQTGTMHGVGGEIDFGIYRRHVRYWERIGIPVFVQHGASTLEKEDFGKMKQGDVGEVHLATEYQKIELGIVADMMPEVGEAMAKWLEALMARDENFSKKFRPMWNLAFGNADLAIAAAKDDGKKTTMYRELAAVQSGKSRAEIITEIMGDFMPKGLKGTLKDAAKELPAPFKDMLWNLPPHVRAAVDKALYEEFATIFDKLGASNTKALVESILPFNKQPVVLGKRSETIKLAVEPVLTQSATTTADERPQSVSLRHVPDRLTVAEMNRSAEIEINAAIQLANEAGVQIPVQADTRFTLLVTSEFFANGELKEAQINYGDRFNLDSVSGRDADEFIHSVLANPDAVKDRTIVLLPNELPDGRFEERHYQALKDAGIRFMIANRNELLTAKGAKDPYRKQFQQDTYVVMLLMRAVDEKIDVSSSVYRLLSFYLKSHFTFAEKIAIDDYIMAIAKNEIGKLIRGILAYRPAQAYDKPDYEKVAATLISA